MGRDSKKSLSATTKKSDTQKRIRSHKNAGELREFDVVKCDDFLSFDTKNDVLDFPSSRVEKNKKTSISKIPIKLDLDDFDVEEPIIEAPKNFGPPKFEDLNTSTSTVMCYSNINFDTKKIFNHIRWTDIDIPHTKKRGNVDKKHIKAPCGSIVSVQSKTEIRGADIRKKKKHWCTICQPLKIQDGSEIKVMTVTEYLEPKLNIDPEENPDEDVISIMYFCSRCQKSYFPHELKKINHFLNQITIVLSVGDQPLLNTMLFKDNLKFAGCKDMDDAVEALLILWQDYISKIPGAWSLKPGHTTPKFAFETVMRNVDFKLGFPIERYSLNVLMNKPEYADRIAMSQYESTGHTNVNIKMFSKKPDNFEYDLLEIPLDHTIAPFIYKTSKLEFKKVKPPKKYVTFIVFSSSETILSGRYHENMKDMYEFFLQVVFDHRDEISEKISAPNKREVAKIKKDYQGFFEKPAVPAVPKVKKTRSK
jgi:hypothetical protein